MQCVKNKRSNSSSGISKSYESKVIRPLQNRRKEHDCIKEITDATVTMSSDKSTKECSSLLIPRSSDRSKQKTLESVDCHSSSTVLLTPPTTQNKSRPPYTVLVPAIRYSGEHTNSTQCSGENVETMSQREPRVNSLSIEYPLQMTFNLMCRSLILIPTMTPVCNLMCRSLILIPTMISDCLIYCLSLIIHSYPSKNLSAQILWLSPIIQTYPSANLSAQTSRLSLILMLKLSHLNLYLTQLSLISLVITQE